MFWENYRLIEAGTKVSLDEFINNKDLVEKVKLGINGLYTDVMTLVEKCINKKDEDAIWELAKRRIISPNNIQEFLDVIDMVKNLNKFDNSIIYTMLVRIMEDLEQLYISVSSYC